MIDVSRSAMASTCPPGDVSGGFKALVSSHDVHSNSTGSTELSHVTQWGSLTARERFACFGGHYCKRRDPVVCTCSKELQCFSLRRLRQTNELVSSFSVGTNSDG